MKIIAEQILKHHTAIVIVIWLCCYLVWLFVLPYAWVDAVQSFIFKGHLSFEHTRPFGALLVAPFLVGLGGRRGDLSIEEHLAVSGAE